MTKKSSRKEGSLGNFQHLMSYFLWLLLALNVASLLNYQFSNMKSDFFHEAAYPYLYAQSDLDTNSLFTSQFSGREIAPISWTLVAHLLLLLGFKLTFMTVAISNIVFLIFAIAVIVWFGSIFALKKIQILLLLTLFTTIYSVRPFRYLWVDQVWIWPMNSYGVYEIFSLLLCILSYKMITNSANDLSFLRVSLQNRYYLIPFFLFGLNHNRGLLEIYGPIGFTLLVLFILPLKANNNISRRSYIRVLVMTFISTIAGRALIGYLTLGVPQYWQQPSQNFTTLDQSNFSTKLISPILTVFQVFGMNPIAGQPVISSHGIRVLSIFIFVLLVVFIPIAKYLQSKNFEKLTLAGKFMFLHLIYFVLVGLLTSLFTNSAGVIRYFIPLAISALFFTPFAFSENIKKQMLYSSVVLIFLAPNVFMGVKHLNEPLDVTYRQTSNYLLTQSLLERNLNYGFVGPWTEDVLTIPFYSDGKIHVSLIDVAPVGPHLHANKSWFSDSDHKGATFVAFPTDTVLKDAKFLDLIKTADSEYVIDKWTVLIYSENPANLIGQLP